jgi:hypothetical protein
VSDLRNGMLVQHTSLGLGKVVALDQKAVHVFFATKDDRFATKLRLPMAGSFLSPSSTRNTGLAKLSAFAFDAEAGRDKCPDTGLAQSAAVARFQKLFPKGFEDPKYVGAGKGKGKKERSVRWRQAGEAFEKTLGGGEGERLLAAGEMDELLTRVRAVEAVVRTLQGTDASWLEPLLSDADAARPFFTALFELLATRAPKQAQFEALLASVPPLSSSAAPECSWPVLTILPFVAMPERHMLLEPRFASEIAQRLGVELESEAPSWTTYRALLDAATLLLEQLRPLGARDFVDVEAFMHLTSAKRKA